MGDLVLVIAALIFKVLGPVILLILAVWGLVLWRKAGREKLSRDSSRGDAALMSLESLRLKAWAIRVAGVVLGLIALAAGLVLGAGLEWSLLIAAAVGSLLMAWAADVKNRYNAGFKDSVVLAELSRVFENLQYRPSECFSGDEIRGLNFFEHHDAVVGNDLIEADYRGVHFAQCDLGVRQEHTVTVKDKDGRSRKETACRDIFRGRAMRFEFDEEFKGIVLVVQRNFNGARFGPVPEAWAKVETELAEFNDHFEVFATSEVEALQVLTPQMIEGIFYLERTIYPPIALYFSGNLMYAFLATRREAFDVSGKETLLEERELLQKDIALVTGFLDAMYFKRQRPKETVGPKGAESRLGAAVEAAAVPRAQPAPENGRASSAVPTRLEYKLGWLGRTLTANPSLILAAIFLASAVYALIKIPSRIALSVSVTGDVVTLDQYVPTVVYLLVTGTFLGLGVLAGGRRKYFSMVWAGLLLLLHFFFLGCNLG